MSYILMIMVAIYIYSIRRNLEYNNLEENIKEYENKHGKLSDDE